jgi:hypothetical protein
VDDPKTNEPVTAARRQFVVWEHFAHRKPETIWKWNASGGRWSRVVVQAAFKDDTYGKWDDPGRADARPHERPRRRRLHRPVDSPRRLQGVVSEGARREDQRDRDRAARRRHQRRLRPEVARERPGADRPARGDAAGPRRRRAPLPDHPGPEGHRVRHRRRGRLLVRGRHPRLGSSADNTPFMEYLRGEIKGSMLVRFSELGHGQTGARATGDVQSKVWYDALTASPPTSPTASGRTSAGCSRRTTRRSTSSRRSCSATSTRAR